MAQPDPYARAFNFTALAPANVPEVGTRLDSELDTLAVVVGQVRDSLARLQRDDGAVLNQAVHPDALSARTRTLIGGGWALRGAWLTGTAYVAKDVVANAGTLYVCLDAHTADVFATDLTAERWLVWYAESTVPGPNTITAAMLSPAFLLPFVQLGNYLATGTGGVARTLQSRLDEDVYLTNFGADPTGAASINTAWTNAVARAEATGATLVVPAGTFRANGTLTFPAQFARGIRQEGVIVSYVTGAPALVIGTDNATAGAYNQSKVYKGLNVERATQSAWASETEIGIRFINADNCQVEITRSEKFTIGVQLFGGLRGCEDSRYHLGRLIDNKVGLDLYCDLAQSWANGNTFHGGHFANQSATNTSLDRFGVRLSFAVGAYNRHNANRFHGPSFELQRQGTPGTVTAIPFLIEADDARDLWATGIRMEECSPFVARHVGGAVGGARDCVYEVGYVGTYGYSGAAVQYSGAAAQAGGAARVSHQAGGALASPRLIANVPDVRAAAFRYSATETGFEGLALMSRNPSGGPTTLTNLIFSGLSSLTLTNNHVVLPSSRGLGFVVDCSQTKDFYIAADGEGDITYDGFGVITQLDGLTPFVAQFDASETALGSGAPVLISNTTCQWVMSKASPPANNPQWWESDSALNAVSPLTTAGIRLFDHQRVTLHDTAKFAVIGVRGDTTARLRALRLYTSAGAIAPRVIAGGPRAWGKRDFAGTLTGWAVPDLAAGAISQLTNVTANQVLVTGARVGDSVSVGYTMSAGSQNGGVVFTGSVSVNDRVSVSAHNQSAGTIQMDGGATETVDLFVAVTKPRA